MVSSEHLEQWNGLLLPTIWRPTVEMIASTKMAALATMAPVTERWLEPKAGGLNLILTYSPTYDVRAIVESLPIKPAYPKSYANFLLTEKELIRGGPHWEEVSLAHWILSEDKSECIADLLYWPSYKFDMLMVAYKLYLKDKGQAVGPDAFLFPGELIGSAEFGRVYGETLKQDCQKSCDENHGGA